MRIVHLISCSGGVFGAEKVMLNVASQMQHQGHESWVVSLNHRNGSVSEVSRQAEARKLPTCDIKTSGAFDLDAINRISEIIEVNDIDVVHTHNYKSNILGLFAARRTGTPIMATVHGYTNRDAKLKLYGVIDRCILRTFNKIVVVDEGQRAMFKGRCQVINNGVESGIHSIVYSTQLRRDLGISDSDFVIGSVGRLNSEKGFDFLLEAFANLGVDNAKLLIVGDGPLREQLADNVERRGVQDKVIFAGFQPEVRPYYSIMDIYVSSSLLEHFPVSILEALGAGKAVVATDVGGTRKLIRHNETGLLIPAGSAEAMASSMCKLIEDQELRQRLGRAAQERVRNHYSAERMGKAYCRVYEDVVVETSNSKLKTSNHE